jgi:hypothetical protein
MRRLISISGISFSKAFSLAGNASFYAHAAEDAIFPGLDLEHFWELESVHDL